MTKRQSDWMFDPRPLKVKRGNPSTPRQGESEMFYYESYYKRLEKHNVWDG